ncbi:putative periplasmic or secreted lipoprotein [Synechococcus sp. PCC 7502]|uniref:type II toxin-antitoxin system HicA family toxin n=1 Tax=Synechococcus sp. PCC 7502 TaxID=1173263 RepID=UPI00029F8DCC|nr:type II toxin-antitoxin system HicA family toxin [Synechococcus sp. PCC 7502]AFY75364.1 putative periplasmic or secreted lipoprotein [Synechococcus sp. PCC 7502]
MGKLRVLSAKELCQILSANGFTQVRQRGSHIIMQKKTDDSTITVPIPNYSEIKIGTLQSIIRQSSLPRSLFEI